MARQDSFLLPAESWPRQGPAIIQGPEARHMLKVLRLNVGDRVRCFDGRGREGIFSILSKAKDRAELGLESEQVQPRPESGLTLALGWNKASRRGWILEKAVELEAERILFWRAERGQGRPPAEPKDSWRDKLVQAAKQCGAVWLPELVVTGDASALAGFAPEYARCYVLWEGSEHRLLRPDDLAEGSCLVVVGPEGGLAETEVEIFTKSGMAPVSLGKRILRYETAALMALALGAHARNALWANDSP